MIDQGLRLGNGVIHSDLPSAASRSSTSDFSVSAAASATSRSTRGFFLSTASKALRPVRRHGLHLGFRSRIDFRRSAPAAPGRAERHPAGLVGERLRSGAGDAAPAGRSSQDEHEVDVDETLRQTDEKTQEEIVNGGSGRGAFVGLVPYLKELGCKRVKTSEQRARWPDDGNTRAPPATAAGSTNAPRRSRSRAKTIWASHGALGR